MLSQVSKPLLQNHIVAQVVSFSVAGHVKKKNRQDSREVSFFSWAVVKKSQFML